MVVEEIEKRGLQMVVGDGGGRESSERGREGG